MSKKEKIPEAIDAAIDEDSVEVSMSPEERDEFVEFMRNKKQIDVEATEKGREYMVHLIYKHHINGVPYGPGRTKLPEDVMGQVVFADEAQKQAEINLYMHKKRAYQLFQGGGAPVLVETK